MGGLPLQADGGIARRPESRGAGRWAGRRKAAFWAVRCPRPAHEQAPGHRVGGSRCEVKTAGVPAGATKVSCWLALSCAPRPPGRRPPLVSLKVSAGGTRLPQAARHVKAHCEVAVVGWAWRAAQRRLGSDKAAFPEYNAHLHAQTGERETRLRIIGGGHGFRIHTDGLNSPISACGLSVG